MVLMCRPGAKEGCTLHFIRLGSAGVRDRFAGTPFLMPRPDGIVDASPEFVDDEHPRRFWPYVHGEFVKFSREAGATSEDILDMSFPQACNLHTSLRKSNTCSRSCAMYLNMMKKRNCQPEYVQLLTKPNLWMLFVL